MPTLTTSRLAESVETLKQAGELALQNPTVEDFMDIERRLSGLAAVIREVQQSMWAREAKATIRRLEKDEPLTATDRDVIRTFIVADAQHYIALENNFHDWLNEFRRLLGELDRRVNTADRDSIGDMRGVVKDAIRLVPDIRNYLEERKRLERFDLAQDTLDTQSRTMLARILKEQLSSPNR